MQNKVTTTTVVEKSAPDWLLSLSLSVKHVILYVYMYTVLTGHLLLWACRLFTAPLVTEAAGSEPQIYRCLIIIITAEA